ncbi:hypothetical protein [Mycobacterium sp. SMC-13]
MDTDTHGEHVAGMEHGANTAAPRTGYGHFSRPQRVGPVGAPRWRPTAAAAPVTNTAAEIKRKRPAGTPGLLVDRILVQTSAGAPLDAILAHVDQQRSGLVLSRGRMSNRDNLRRLIKSLPERDFGAPVVFDPEGYRRHTATVQAPFHFGDEGIIPGSLEENLSSQRWLGVDVAQTPTGLIGIDNIEALESAVEQANRLCRDDFMFTAPLNAAILDDADLTARIWGILNGVKAPVSLVLSSQFDPFDTNAESRIAAVRSFAAGPAAVAAFRTDFNAFDLLCHGSFSGAIGTGGSMRHATAAGKQSFSADPTDQSPSVLYERLGCWWRGSKVARVHGRSPAPICDCAICNGRHIDRFLTRQDSDEAYAHGVLIWQRWVELLVGQDSMADRATFWKAFCQSRIDEHKLLSTQLRRAKPLAVRPAFKAWAKLPA